MITKDQQLYELIIEIIDKFRINNEILRSIEIISQNNLFNIHLFTSKF